MAQGIMHEPIIDFRDYKIGTDIKGEKTKSIKTHQNIRLLFLKNQKTGEVLKVNQDDYIKETKYWAEGSPGKLKKEKNESVLVKEGYKSEIVNSRLKILQEWNYRGNHQSTKSYFSILTIRKRFLLIFFKK
jgi:hypothetical protein